MSGGVDSSVTAALLQKQGYHVEGATMSLNTKFSQTKNQKAIDDAQQTAKFLNISHYVFDFSHEFESTIIENFKAEYALGRTPNPCVLCNYQVKFGLFFQKALQMGFDYVATGHYANKFQNSLQRWTFLPAQDSHKDQRYYLYRLSQLAIEKTLFPLANYNKEQVRQLAKEYNLPVAQKSDSQDICFVEENDYRAFLRKTGFAFQAGRIITQQEGDEKVLGYHQGKENFTVGQRKGLGVSASQPLYVTQIKNNGDVIVAEKKHSQQKNFFLQQLNFLAQKEEFFKEGWQPVWAQIRYRSSPLEAWAFCTKEHFAVELKDYNQGVTPGQSVVLYSPQDNALLCGGIIV